MAKHPDNYCSYLTVSCPAGGGDMETAKNKVSKLSPSSTNEQYPSAKCVYDAIGDIESILHYVNHGE